MVPTFGNLKARDKTKDFLWVFFPENEQQKTEEEVNFTI